VQARVPFLDKAFMDVVMHLDPKVLHLLAFLVLRYKYWRRMHLDPKLKMISVYLLYWYNRTNTDT
jgi:asparagine synthetase B (glutamine-hydrolysing)